MADGHGSSYVTPSHDHRIETDRVPYAVLNIDQFRKFMSVIKQLGDRVEREHSQFLRDSQRLEDRSSVSVSGVVSSNPVGGEVNFEDLVGRGDGVTVKQDTVIDGSSKGWDEDDVWGSIFSNEEAVGVCLYVYVQVYLPDILGVHADNIPSTSHTNGIITVNSYGIIPFTITTSPLESEPIGYQADLFRVLRFLSLHSNEHNHTELFDPTSATTPVEYLLHGSDEHQQLRCAELQPSHGPAAFAIK